MNLSQKKREELLAFLRKLREEHNDDASIIAFNEIENELTSKKYGLVWEEHSEEVDEQIKTQVPVFRNLLERTIMSDETLPFNFLLEGDNLHSLKLLEKTHKGKIDVIYIDPPYNRGKDDFIYNDCMIGLEDGFRHSKWLSFMERRLSIAKSLLRDDGVIFISIDDNEQATLKLLCESIFGEKNFVSQLVWEKKKKGSFLSKSITNIKEYILVFAKNIQMFKGLVGELNNKTETYPCINAVNKRELRYIPRGIKSNYKELDYFLPSGSEISYTTMSIVLHSDLVIKDGYLAEDLTVEGNWRYSQSAMYEYAQKGELYLTHGLYLRRIVNDTRIKMMKDLLPRTGDDVNLSYNSEIDINNLFSSGWGSNEDADEELRVLFNKQKLFDYPKPTRLLIKLFASYKKENAIILDFFAGSGTTAQAVMELNKQDGGNRRFILCTNNENGICENITYQRIKTVITGKRADGSEWGDGIPANLKYFKTDYIAKASDDIEYCVGDNLLHHIAEMVELQHGTDIDNDKHILVLTDEEADNLTEEQLANCEELYISSSVLLTAEQEKMFKRL